jgi:hypothetical protein
VVATTVSRRLVARPREGLAQRDRAVACVSLVGRLVYLRRSRWATRSRLHRGTSGLHPHSQGRRTPWFGRSGCVACSLPAKVTYSNPHQARAGVPPVHYRSQARADFVRGILPCRGGVEWCVGDPGLRAMAACICVVSWRRQGTRVQGSWVHRGRFGSCRHR